MKIFLAILFVILVFFAGRLGELYTQLARYQKYWLESNLQPIQPDDFVYIAFGDSAAQGIGASNPLKGYVGLIAGELQEQQSKQVKTINLSKSGAKIKDVLDVQLPAFKKLNLSNDYLLTIEIGANDIITFDKNKFETEMNELMQNLPAKTIMSDIPSFSGSRYGKYETRVSEANKIIHRLAKDHGITLAELHKKVAASHSLRTFAADIFHPSDYGYKTNWLPAFTEKIK